MKGDEFRRATRNILTHYRAADAQTHAAGLQWYPEAQWLCTELGRLYEVDAPHAVVALAHLSPRVSWSQNLRLLETLLAGKPKPLAALTRSWEIASASLQAEDPMATFSRRADKTRSFAQAILGDGDAVVLDTWAARVAGFDADLLRGRTAYRLVADSYRRAARIAGVQPREMQAITWCHVRGKVG